ncbi:MAG TPA: hypothetical protein VFK04_04950 [Gemmatimonadaceae bacterium]|nr:hypothetical protein [Gemmatimonadaceae bacterium]
MSTHRILSWLRSRAQSAALIASIVVLTAAYNWHRLFPTSPRERLEGTAWTSSPLPDVGEALVQNADGTAAHSYLELSGHGRSITTRGIWYLAAGDKALCFQAANNAGVPWGPPECRVLWFNSPDYEDEMYWVPAALLESVVLPFSRVPYRKPRK